MSPSTHASGRPARDGSHLTLVASQDAPAPGQDATKDDAPRPAEQPRALAIAGSVTARALIALGALASALGVPLHKGDVVYKTHEVSPGTSVDESEPGEDNAPVNTTGAAHTSAGTTRVSAGYWTPAIKPVQVVVYKLPAPIQGTGRHRKPTTEHHTHTHAHGVGRHRKPAERQLVEPCEHREHREHGERGRELGEGVEVPVSQPPQMVAMAEAHLSVGAFSGLGRE